MSEVYNVYEAKTHLSALIDRAAKGEEIVIAKAGAPQAMLVPVPRKKTKRIPGRLKGRVWIAPDAFSSGVDAKISADFYAGEIFPSNKKPRQ